MVEVILILLFLSSFTLNQKKPVYTEDPFNDDHQERQEVEMLAKKFEMKYVSIKTLHLPNFILLAYFFFFFFFFFFPVTGWEGWSYLLPALSCFNRLNPNKWLDGQIKILIGLWWI